MIEGKIKIYTPDEKLPPEYMFVYAVVSGKPNEHTTWDHTPAVVSWAPEGWFISELNDEHEMDKMTVDAWFDVNIPVGPVGDIPIEDLDISVHSYLALRRLDISGTSELLSKDIQDGV